VTEGSSAIAVSNFGLRVERQQMVVAVSSVSARSNPSASDISYFQQIGQVIQAKPIETRESSP
jgi:hypothetical protein